jgi:hypothetical protein
MMEAGMAEYTQEQIATFTAIARQHHIDAWDLYLKRLEAREKLAAEKQPSKDEQVKQQ